jgi:hypothetical protein
LRFWCAYDTSIQSVSRLLAPPTNRLSEHPGADDTGYPGHGLEPSGGGVERPAHDVEQEDSGERG